MLRITVTGIFAATILGTMLGIARLSKNYIVEKSATGILEIVRNVPLLVQILFFQALILTLPRLEVSEIGTYTIHASAKGIAFPWPNREPNAILFMVYFIYKANLMEEIYYCCLFVYIHKIQISAFFIKKLKYMWGLFKLT